MSVWKPTITSDELYHHGILGQKWGQRNGPPYPLGAGDHSAREKEAGYQKSIRGSGKAQSIKNQNGSKKSSDASKQGVIDPTLATYATFAALYVSAKLVAKGISVVRHHTLNEPYRKKLNEKRANEEIDPKTKLHMKPPGDKSNDIAEVNPEFTDPKKGLTPGTYQNCVRCTFAYELRKRGYDCSAELSHDPTNGLKATKKLFKNVTNVEVEPVDYKNFETITRLERKAASKEGNRKLAQKAMKMMSNGGDQRGQVLVTWNRYGGHSMAYEVKNGKLTIVDSQSNKTYTGKEAEELLAHTCFIQYQRLDNLEFNEKKARNYVV